MCVYTVNVTSLVSPPRHLQPLKGGGGFLMSPGRGISGLSFDSLFLSPLLFFCQVFFVVIVLLMIHSPDFFSSSSVTLI